MKIECEDCQTGEMIQRHRRSDGRVFYGCSEYPTCDATMSEDYHKRAGLLAVGEHPDDAWTDALNSWGD